MKKKKVAIMRKNDIWNSELIKIGKEDNNEYFLGTGKGTSLKDVASIFEELSGKKPNIAWGALDYRPNDVMLAKFSEKNSCKIIKWKSSISLKEGIKMMLSKEPKCSTQ